MAPQAWDYLILKDQERDGQVCLMKATCNKSVVIVSLGVCAVILGGGVVILSSPTPVLEVKTTFHAIPVKTTFHATPMPHDKLRGYYVDVQDRPQFDLLPVLVDFHGYLTDAVYQRNWTLWHRYLQRTDHPFILVTPHGSGDSTNQREYPEDMRFVNKTRAWNALGWSFSGAGSSPLKTSPASNVTSECSSQELSSCFDWRGNYICYHSQPCIKGSVREVWGVDNVVISEDKNLRSLASCATMSAVDDAAYVSDMLEFVLRTYRGDPDRIYFFGQSMGGVASLGFSAPDVQVKPAATIPCSAGAARSRTLDLKGKVHTLLLHGDADDVMPPWPSAGYLINGSKACPGSVSTCESFASIPTSKLGCKNKWGDHTAITGDGYMIDPMYRTLAGIRGVPDDSKAKEFFDSLQFEKKAIGSCARVSSSGARSTGTNVPNIEICIFDGYHELPLMDKHGNWTTLPRHISGAHLFHDYVWRHFLQNGKLKRIDAN